MRKPLNGVRVLEVAQFTYVPSAGAVLDELIRRSDVFLTNYLPSARQKLNIDVQHIRSVNPDTIYVAGSGFGMNGPDRDAGAYDATAFWARGGSADGLNPPDADQSAFMPAGPTATTSAA
jgi:crotonobetainyl-CoA:carnitine CoA-transferase CaiB-like acyl-CoA transferase